MEPLKLSAMLEALSVATERCLPVLRRIGMLHANKGRCCAERAVIQRVGGACSKAPHAAACRSCSAPQRGAVVHTCMGLWPARKMPCANGDVAHGGDLARGSTMRSTSIAVQGARTVLVCCRPPCARKEHPCVAFLCRLLCPKHPNERSEGATVPDDVAECRRGSSLRTTLQPPGVQLPGGRAAAVPGPAEAAPAAGCGEAAPGWTAGPRGRPCARVRRGTAAPRPKT